MINFLNTPDLIQQRAEIEIIVKVAIVDIESTIILATEILPRVKVVTAALIVIVGINAVVVNILFDSAIVTLAEGIPFRVEAVTVALVVNIPFDSAIVTLAEGIPFRVEADSVALVVNILFDSAITVALVVHLVKDSLR